MILETRDMLKLHIVDSGNYDGLNRNLRTIKPTTKVLNHHAYKVDTIIIVAVRLA